MGGSGMLLQNTLVVGKGGREHAFAWKLAQSPRVNKGFVAPGNGGTGQMGGKVENALIDAMDFQTLARFAKDNQCFTVVGPDDPLAEGIVDFFQINDLSIFGPTKAAAKIESSKSFAKMLMLAAGVPTANFQVCHSYDKALLHISHRGFPLVIKADGLAMGKGVDVCETPAEARQSLFKMMCQPFHGDAGKRVVIEDKEEGWEFSVHAFCDGRHGEEGFRVLPIAQDHKRLLDGDKGPNTGSMGAVCPVPRMGGGITMGAIAMKIVKPIVNTMANDGYPFTGIMYPGVMATAQGAKVLEVNARAGDPEWQLHVLRLETDLFEVLEACVQKRLHEVSLSWRPGFAACVVLASGGYPGDYRAGLVISGLEEAAHVPGVEIFHAGTIFNGQQFLTAGGRVLNVTALGSTLQEALDRAYQAAALIYFEGMHYRKDIGRQALAMQLQSPPQ